jgi:hypothetical protein
MRILLATRQLDGPGGAETYLVTVAEWLRRLGHDVSFTASRVGDLGGGAYAAGFEVLDAVHTAEPAPEAIIVQDRALSLRLARRHPESPQVFVVHGVEHDYELPQPGVNAVVAIVVLNDRHLRRAPALAGSTPVVRLRQPIDIRRFKGHGEPRPRPRRALVLSNNFPPERARTLERAWGPAGIEVVSLGRNDALGIEGEIANDPRAAISAADIVVGYGRAMLEALACRRAAFVYAGPGGDGWVTADKFAAMESDGFAGGAFAEVYDERALGAALDDYDPKLGQVGRDLVRFPHDAGEHAASLMALITAAAPVAPDPPDRLRELERMVDLLWQAEGRVSTLRVEVGALYEQLALRDRRLEETFASRRYRIGSALARPLELLRQRR